MRLAEIKTPVQKRAVLELQQGLVELGYEVTSVSDHAVGSASTYVEVMAVRDGRDYRIVVYETGMLISSLGNDLDVLTSHDNVQSFLTSIKDAPR